MDYGVTSLGRKGVSSFFPFFLSSFLPLLPFSWDIIRQVLRLEQFEEDDQREISRS